MTEKEKKEQSFITVDGKEYKEDDLNDEQKAMVNHLVDLNRKIGSAEFNLVQLRFGRQAFADAFKASLEKEVESSEESEK